ncbi:MerR family transcriptional regulator [Paraclostridium benzoelyticum]|uniref:MerR family transcriptional regulator n=1 Tax=Paraclostridium benzoelyticum TaxID=1629550 RepID=UPI0031CD9D0C
MKFYEKFILYRRGFKNKKVTVKALRYYYKVGILIHKYIDDNTGYRYYSIDQFIHIDVIKGCRALGTSIAELQEIVIAPCKEVGSLKELISYSELEKIIKNKNLNMSIERGIGYDFNSDGEVEPFYVFNEIIKDENIKIDKHIDLLPKGEYLTLAYIKENNLKLKKFIEIELFNDFFNTKTYSCQIQILI